MSANYKNPDSHNIIGLAGYPDSGAFAHLPLRTTITGDAMMPHPSANKIFLRNLPAHCYTLPNVKLNFTLVEIIAFLPNWFKNRALASRFMNNDLTANVHFTIFEEHRECNFASDHEREKARKTITEEYRKTMRSIYLNRGWTKAKHVSPSGWDHMLISMDGFVPDDTQFDGYLEPTPISFHHLTVGVKKLPEGVHAGDLTRAVQFALQHPENLMFPNDLPRILDHIGRTKITVAHTDRAIARAYVERMRKGTGFRRSKRAPEEGVVAEKAREPASWRTQPEWNTAMTFQQYPHSVPKVLMTPPDGYADFQLESADVDRSDEVMDALLRPHLAQEGFEAPTLPVSPYELYHPHRLLRECIESNVGFDGSPLARAAQFSQQPDQIDTDWHVEEISWLIQLLDATAAVAGGL